MIFLWLSQVWPCCADSSQVMYFPVHTSLTVFPLAILPSVLVLPTETQSSRLYFQSLPTLFSNEGLLPTSTWPMCCPHQTFLSGRDSVKTVFLLSPLFLPNTGGNSPFNLGKTTSLFSSESVLKTLLCCDVYRKKKAIGLPVSLVLLPTVCFFVFPGHPLVLIICFCTAWLLGTKTYLCPWYCRMTSQSLLICMQDLP